MLSEQLKLNIEAFITANYEEIQEEYLHIPADSLEEFSDLSEQHSFKRMFCNATVKLSLNDMIGELDESFSEMLLRKINEKGMKDAECYKKALVDRKLFSKIRNDKHYRPSKETAVAFAIALELPLEETKELLLKAGFALSHSSKFDIIIEYFITSNNYNILEINEALYEFDQKLLGY